MENQKNLKRLTVYQIRVCLIIFSIRSDNYSVPNACNTTLVAVCVCIMKKMKITYGETSSNTKGKIMLIIV